MILYEGPLRNLGDAHLDDWVYIKPKGRYFVLCKGRSLRDWMTWIYIPTLYTRLHLCYVFFDMIFLGPRAIDVATFFIVMSENNI